MIFIKVITNYNTCIYLTALILFTACKTDGVVFENAICIENISTIDPVDGLKNNQTIVIKDERILKIFNSEDLTLSKLNNIINGTNKFLIPGLWDTHVHYAYTTALTPRMSDLFIAFGITSVRDTGGNINVVKKWKDKALAQPQNAPRIFMAGPLLDGLPNIYNGSDKNHPNLSVGLSSLNGITKQINFLENKGVDFLKAYEMLNPEQFVHIINVGHKKGLKVTGHVPLSMDVISASNAGLHSMEHLRNLELSCASNSEELWLERIKMLQQGKTKPGSELRLSIHKAQQEIAIKNYDDTKANEILEVLKKNNTWQVPTLALNTFFSRKYYANEQYQKYYRFLPDSVQSYWTERSNVLLNYPVTKFRKQYDAWHYKMVKKIHQANIPIMAGTETPIAYLIPGLSLHEELAALVEAGLSPLEALKTATINPSKYFNLQNQLGLIQQNMWADLIILNDNPLDNIKNTTHINSVIKQGKVYTRKNLDNLLNKLPSKN